jgi:hypothetical protein
MFETWRIISNRIKALWQVWTCKIVSICIRGFRTSKQEYVWRIVSICIRDFRISRQVLTAQWGAPQPEGTRSNPWFLILELQTFNVPPYRWPIRFLSSSHPPGTHVWIYQWFDQFSGFSCFRSNNSKCFGFRAHWHSKLTHISWFWIQIGPFFDLWQPKNHRKPSKMRGLELPVNKALPTEISFRCFLYTIRHTKWRDLANKCMRFWILCHPDLSLVICLHIWESLDIPTYSWYLGYARWYKEVSKLHTYIYYFKISGPH